MSNRGKLLIPLLLLAWAAGARGEAFKCRAPDGRILVSNTPCQQGSQTLAVRPEDRVSPEQRLLAEQELERQRRTLAEREAARAAEEEREQGARQKLAEEESSRRTRCLENAQWEPDPQFRADLIAACNGVAPQRPVVVQQPIVIPVGPARRLPPPGGACISGDCRVLEPVPQPLQLPPNQTRSDCRQVGGRLRCD
jgi:hypothetical protein